MMVAELGTHHWKKRRELIIGKKEMGTSKSYLRNSADFHDNKMGVFKKANDASPIKQAI